MTPQSRIKAFVEEEKKTGRDEKALIHRAIKLGLELGREAMRELDEARGVSRDSKGGMSAEADIDLLIKSIG